MSKMKWARCCAKVCLKPSRILGRHDVNRIDLRVGAKRVFQDRKTKKELFAVPAPKGVMHLECFQAHQAQQALEQMK